MPETQVATPPQTTSPAVTTGVFDHLATPPAKTEPAKTGTDTSTKPVETSPKLYAGRFKAPEDLEIAYGESTKEGIRLYNELTQREQSLSELKEKLADMEDQVKLRSTVPAFRELSEDALKKLAQDDPLAASRYLVQKELHERDSASHTEKLKAQRIAESRQRESDQQFIISRVKDLASNPKDYPEYTTLMPDIENISKRLGADFQGKRWSADVAYLVALGRKHLAMLKESSAKTNESAKTASDTAKATATATAPGAVTRTEVSSPEDTNSDDSVVNRILKAASSKFFAKV